MDTVTVVVAVTDIVMVVVVEAMVTAMELETMVTVTAQKRMEVWHHTWYVICSAYVTISKINADWILLIHSLRMLKRKR